MWEKSEGGKECSGTILILIFALKFLLSLFPSGVWFRTLRSFQILSLVGRGWLYKDPWLFCFEPCRSLTVLYSLQPVYWSYTACSVSSWESWSCCLCPVPCLEVEGCRKSKCAREGWLGREMPRSAHCYLWESFGKIPAVFSVANFQLWRPHLRQPWLPVLLFFPLRLREPQLCCGIGATLCPSSGLVCYLWLPRFAWGLGREPLS